MQQPPRNRIVEIDWIFEEPQKIEDNLYTCIQAYKNKKENKQASSLILSTAHMIKRNIYPKAISMGPYTNPKDLDNVISIVWANSRDIVDILVKIIVEYCETNRNSKIGNSPLAHKEIQNAIKGNCKLSEAEARLNYILINGPKASGLDVNSYMEAISHIMYLIGKNITPVNIRMHPSIFNNNVLRSLILGGVAGISETKGIKLNELDRTDLQLLNPNTKIDDDIRNGKNTFSGLFLNRTSIEKFLTKDKNTSVFDIKDKINRAKLKYNGYKELKYIARLLNLEDILPQIEKDYLKSVRYSYIDSIFNNVLVNILADVLLSVRNRILRVKFAITSISIRSLLPRRNIFTLDLIILICSFIVCIIMLFTMISMIKTQKNINIIKS